VMVSPHEYALMCEMDRILIAPAGQLELSGFAVEGTSIGAALRKAGIRAEFLRRGDYKSAPELFTRDRLSPTLREMVRVPYEHLLAQIAKGRKVPLEEARRKVDSGPYSATRALAEGLCDALVAEADLPELLVNGELPERTLEPGQTRAEYARKVRPEARFEERFKLATYATYTATQPWPKVRWRPVRRLPQVGLVKVEGAISFGGGSPGLLGPRIAGAEGIVKALRSARRDDRTKAVLLYIDSPGGSANASELILEEIQRTVRTKPVVAFFDRVAASGGYMAALGAEEIWAGPMAIGGSIGVFVGKFDASGLLATLGINREQVALGRNAGLESVSRGFSEDQRRSLDRQLDETYESFLRHVSEARKLSREEAHARGEGRIYAGDALVTAKLADRIGTFDGACRRALELGGVPAAPDFDVKTFGSRLGTWSSWLPAAYALCEPRVYALWAEGVRSPQDLLATQPSTECP
jgi:protease IV